MKTHPRTSYSTLFQPKPHLRFGWQVKSNIQFVEKAVGTMQNSQNCPPGLGVEDGTWFYIQSEDGDLVIRQNPAYKIATLTSFGVKEGTVIARDPGRSHLSQSLQEFSQWLLEVISPRLSTSAKTEPQ